MMCHGEMLCGVDKCTNLNHKHKTSRQTVAFVECGRTCSRVSQTVVVVMEHLPDLAIVVVLRHLSYAVSVCVWCASADVLRMW